MTNEKFSVSMCVYGKDNPDWFREAVNSILSQSVPPDEVVLVVDGPVPDTLGDVIDSFENGDTFRVIRLPENRGHGDARRIGLANCTHEIVALMDADDIALPDRFEKQIAAMTKDPALSIIGGKIAEFMDAEDNIIGYRTVPTAHGDICSYMKRRCPFNQMTVMFRKSHVEEAGGYLDWYCDEDYYLWARMYLAGMRFANLPDTLVHARVNADTYCRRGGKRYFQSEAKLQGYMLKKKIISLPRYLINVTERFILQILMPNSLRSLVFKKFARSKT
ncbi:MAG: glycosyltransferase [Clostridia bacterium]|nr:glycosyltransferase [Clostridia bacterium]